jgi:hypothetical protein
MSEEEAAPWERREGEERWYSRFLLYRDMGYSRSLLGTVHLEEAQKSTGKRSISVPGAWLNAFKRWDWKKRAQAWDDEQERLTLAATKYGRISERAKLLDEWISTQDSIMKVHIAEKGYVRADNMEQLRGLLDDMAKETGGRVKVTKQEHSGALDIQGAKDRLLQKLQALPDDDDDLL